MSKEKQRAERRRKKRELENLFVFEWNLLSIRETKKTVQTIRNSKFCQHSKNRLLKLFSRSVFCWLVHNFDRRQNISLHIISSLLFLLWIGSGLSCVSHSYSPYIYEFDLTQCDSTYDTESWKTEHNQKCYDSSFNSSLFFLFSQRILVLLSQQIKTGKLEKFLTSSRHFDLPSHTALSSCSHRAFSLHSVVCFFSVQLLFPLIRFVA